MRAARTSALLALVCATMVLPGHAHAQLPRTGVRLLAPFAAGGPIDFSARVIAESMQAQTGIPLIVENRTGANGAIAATAVKQAAPDGATCPSSKFLGQLCHGTKGVSGSSVWVQAAVAK